VVYCVFVFGQERDVSEFGEWNEDGDEGEEDMLVGFVLILNEDEGPHEEE